jgi:hypothetical protein
MKYHKKPVEIEALQWTKNHEEMEAFVGAHADVGLDYVWIRTLEGVMTANVGDYVIKGIKSEFYPCKPDIFEATYEKVTE